MSARANDLVRLVRGFGLIVEQAAKLQSPAVATHLRTAAEHAASYGKPGSASSDLLKQMDLMRHADSTANPNNNISTSNINHHSKNTPGGMDAGFRLEVSLTAGTSNHPPQQQQRQQPLPEVYPTAIARDTQIAEVVEPESSREMDSAQTVDIKKQHRPFPQAPVQPQTAKTPNARVSNVQPDRKLTEAKSVPSSPIARAFGFGSLGAQLAVSALSTAVSNVGASEEQREKNNDEAMKQNAEEIANALRTMRGAALKIGQWMSLQEESVLPAPLAAALETVRTGAYTMPKDQLHGVLKEELGAEWRDLFEGIDEDGNADGSGSGFVDEPIAAASIGQVHRAVTKEGVEIVLKVQYPGVAGSIHSDLRNLERMLMFSAMIPKGMYLEKVIATGRNELLLECDYEFEAKQQTRYKGYVDADPRFAAEFMVPAVLPELSTTRVLASEMAPGMPFESNISDLPQDVRDSICERLLRLTLTELFVWRYMQTDPNMGNYLYDVETDRVVLLDFGASRQYASEFTEGYMNIVWSAAELNEKGLWDASLDLNFVTGEESDRMKEAHIKSGMIMGEPFEGDVPYDFAESDIMLRLREHAKIFLTDRLTPPPVEAYSLQRKLAGVYLTCIKLGGKVQGRNILLDIRAQLGLGR